MKMAKKVVTFLLRWANHMSNFTINLIFTEKLSLQVFYLVCTILFEIYIDIEQNPNKNISLKQDYSIFSFYGASHLFFSKIKT